MIMSEGGRLKSFIVDPIEAFFFFNEDIKRQGTKIPNLTIFYIPYTIQFGLRGYNKVVNLPFFYLPTKKMVVYATFNLIHAVDFLSYKAGLGTVCRKMTILDGLRRVDCRPASSFTFIF